MICLPSITEELRIIDPGLTYLSEIAYSRSYTILVRVPIHANKGSYTYDLVASCSTMGSIITGIWNMSNQLRAACPIKSMVKVDDDHCSQGMFKPDKL